MLQYTYLAISVEEALNILVTDKKKKNSDGCILNKSKKKT